jgi:hypothetical protein
MSIKDPCLGGVWGDDGDTDMEITFTQAVNTRQHRRNTSALHEKRKEEGRGEMTRIR